MATSEIRKQFHAPFVKILLILLERQLEDKTYCWKLFTVRDLVTTGG